MGDSSLAPKLDVEMPVLLRGKKNATLGVGCRGGSYPTAVGEDAKDQTINQHDPRGTGNISCSMLA
jgi:hypothetical protein